MPSFAKLAFFAGLAVFSSATTISTIVERAAAHEHHCPGAKVAHLTTVDVGGKVVTHTTFQCDKSTNDPSRRTLVNVCGELCTTTCNDNSGNLPPITEDCQTIEDAIQIYAQQLSTFVVNAHSLESLTYGTCTYFFSNNSSRQLQYCWDDLATIASMAGDACYPPVQPFYSEGLCTAHGGAWAIGSAHS